jgi:hypothetical protein
VGYGFRRTLVQSGRPGHFFSSGGLYRDVHGEGELSFILRVVENSMSKLH